MLVAQSFSKIAGLYGERLGALHITCPDQDTVTRVRSQLTGIIRREYSSSPKYPATLVSIVFEDKELYADWMRNLQAMAARIVEMRHALVDKLTALGTPGSWDHLVRQKGMFG